MQGSGRDLNARLTRWLLNSSLQNSQLRRIGLIGTQCVGRSRESDGEAHKYCFVHVYDDLEILFGFGGRLGEDQGTGWQCC